MSSAQPLLSAAVRQLSRSACGVAVKPVMGFHVFRIDGYSWTKMLLAGDRISSEQFDVGGRNWRIDYYPNGTNRATDSDSDFISLHLRLDESRRRARAQWRFSLLDPSSGDAAYELPAATGVFTCPDDDDSDDEEPEEIGPACGCANFVVTKAELERRRETLLKDDCLAIRCDVGVVEVETLDVTPERRPMRPAGGYDGGGGGYGSPDEMFGEHEGWRSQPPPPDDREYIRRCLTAQR